MKRLHFQQSDFAEKIRELAASGAPNPEIEARTADIIAAVRDRRDAALVELTARFDGWQPASPSDFRVSEKEFREANAAVAPSFKKAARLAHKNITAFAKRCLKKDFSTKNAQGGRVGEKYDPLQRVGIYVPGGTAPLASTVLMTVTLARAAGCPQIVVCTPARKKTITGGTGVPARGSQSLSIDSQAGTPVPPTQSIIAPEILCAAQLAGATEIYKLGGAQAVAVMALGTPTIPRVAKIFGPGNAYVVAAKRQLFGRVGVDLLPGPSELLVIADKTANPSFIAADLLAQAEHGSGMERVWLVTDSEIIANAVETELDKIGGTGVPSVDSGVAALLRSADKKDSALHRSAATPSRIQYIQKSLANAAIIVTKDLRQAADIANDFAPEHLELMVAKPKQLLPRLKTAGAIFVGSYTPTVLGDYIAGTSHVLPTGGAGKFCSGLTVDQFLRKTSVVEYNAAALRKSLAAVRELASAEGLEAHRKSAEIRFEATNPHE